MGDAGAPVSRSRVQYRRRMRKRMEGLVATVVVVTDGVGIKDEVEEEVVALLPPAVEAGTGYSDLAIASPIPRRMRQGTILVYREPML